MNPPLVETIGVVGRILWRTVVAAETNAMAAPTLATTGVDLVRELDELGYRLEAVHARVIATGGGVTNEGVVTVWGFDGSQWLRLGALDSDQPILSYRDLGPIAEARLLTRVSVYERLTLTVSDPVGGATWNLAIGLEVRRK